MVIKAIIKLTSVNNTLLGDSSADLSANKDDNLTKSTPNQLTYSLVDSSLSPFSLAPYLVPYPDILLVL